jgi:hypothetical protein
MFESNSIWNMVLYKCELRIWFSNFLHIALAHLDRCIPKDLVVLWLLWMSSFKYIFQLVIFTILDHHRCHLFIYYVTTMKISLMLPKFTWFFLFRFSIDSHIASNYDVYFFHLIFMSLLYFFQLVKIFSGVLSSKSDRGHSWLLLT